MNEELYTVNTEYQQKVEELTTMTNDLSNFLSSTMIGILFVDGKLNIRKFTECIGREFQPVSYTHLDVYKRQVYVWYNHVRPPSYNGWKTPFEARYRTYIFRTKCYKKA